MSCCRDTLGNEGPCVIANTIALNADPNLTADKVATAGSLGLCGPVGTTEACAPDCCNPNDPHADEATVAELGQRIVDAFQEQEPKLIAAGGWCAPTGDWFTAVTDEDRARWAAEKAEKKAAKKAKKKAKKARKAAAANQAYFQGPKFTFDPAGFTAELTFNQVDPELLKLLTGCDDDILGTWYTPGVGVNEVPAEPKVESILEEAERIINGPRRESYGHPAVNFQRVADLWNAYLSNKTESCEAVVTSVDVAALMILLKLARLLQNDEDRDGIVDIAGYAGCIERVVEHRKATRARLAEDVM